MIKQEFRDMNDHPSDVETVYVDGYAIEERMLEGVRFKVEKVRLGLGYQLVCNSVHADDTDYIRKYNKKTKREWYQAAVDYLVSGEGDARSEDGVDVVWVDETPDAKSTASPQDVEPMIVGKTSISSVLGKL